MRELGYLYVLANSAMPNMVKVGKTTRSPEERAVELSKATGLPTPFIVVYEQLFANCSEAEYFVHTYLGSKGYRVADNREFFNAPVSIVIKAISLAPNAIEDQLSNQESEEDDDLIDRSENYDELDDLSLDDEEIIEPWMAIFEEAESHYYGLGDYIVDYSEAMRLYKQSAKLGALEAYGRIGKMYKSGEGVHEDKNKALEFFKEGARKGNVYCYWAMGILFLEEENNTNAEKCFSLFLKNKPQTLPDRYRLSSDDLQDIFFDCTDILCRHLEGVEDVHRAFNILCEFIVENKNNILSHARKLHEISISRSHSEMADYYNSAIQYLNTLEDV
ncbi:MAG: hypothetical protein RLZZ352_296 [Pseudomonadota bacterium]|jgi:hypothetical protein